MSVDDYPRALRLPSSAAPRCGTTSLARYLASHPDICFSKVKEPHFFAMHDLSGNVR